MWTMCIYAALSIIKHPRRDNNIAEWENTLYCGKMNLSFVYNFWRLSHTARGEKAYMRRLLWVMPNRLCVWRGKTTENVTRKQNKIFAFFAPLASHVCWFARSCWGCHKISLVFFFLLYSKHNHAAVDLPQSALYTYISICTSIVFWVFSGSNFINCISMIRPRAERSATMGNTRKSAVLNWNAREENRWDHKFLLNETHLFTSFLILMFCSSSTWYPV